MSETAKVRVRELHLTFGCILEGNGEKCFKNPPFSCILPLSQGVAFTEPMKYGVCPYLVAIDSLARSLRRYEKEKEAEKR